MGSYKGQRSPGFYMDDTLKANLDVLLKNITKDWDFVVVISGGGRVRLGKSTIALQIGAYWTQQIKELYGLEVPFNVKDNIVFNGSELIKHGNKLGTKHKHSCLVFDEAGADLEGIKAMKKTTQAVKDYLRECGQYNMLTILVLPEYFDLPKGVALSRCDFLINCYTSVTDDDLIERGYFNFYSRPNKKYLYLKGKKDLNYNSYPEDWSGTWENFYPVDEKEYRSAKVKALKSRENVSAKELRKEEFLRAAFKYMIDNGLSYREISDEICKRSPIKMSYVYVGRLLKKEEEETDE